MEQSETEIAIDDVSSKKTTQCCVCRRQPAVPLGMHLTGYQAEIQLHQSMTVGKLVRAANLAVCRLCGDLPAFGLRPAP